VSCIRPGTVSPDDLIAFNDGGAPPNVVEHVRACPDCAATARTYATTERRLARDLHRFECPTPQVLGEYDLGVVPAQEHLAIAMHVRDCPRCSDELHTLRNFLAVEDVPNAEPRVARLRRLIATLLPSAPTSQPLAGLRGTAEAGIETYAAGDFKLTISYGPEVRRDAGRMSKRVTSLTGLVWSDATTSEATLAGVATLTGDDGTARTANVDELGNFTFEDVKVGAYRLEMSLGDQVILIESLRIGP